MIRLKDIARQAGVSVMTVSKVLRDAPDISVETKARIRVLAQQMGYVPDSLAQGLRTRKTRLLGVVIPTITHPMFVRVLLALEERAHEAGYDLILTHTLNLPEREEWVIRRLLSRRVDGLLVSPVYRPATSVPIYEELRRCGTPVVVVGSGAPFCAPFLQVQGDDFQAASNMTRHLLALGHRRIAYLSGPHLLPWSQERLGGYRKALRDAQIEFDDRLVFSAGATVEDGEKAARQMLAETAEATAVQAVNDPVAVGAANVLLEQGRRIPEDFSVTGFGNFPISEHGRVPLTTVRQPKYRLGLAAMNVLLRLLAGEKPLPEKIAAELILRKSTAPPSATPR
jgi:DNA-binding LacI/PurR family transcriptional regulator